MIRDNVFYRVDFLGVLNNVKTAEKEGFMELNFQQQLGPVI
jgi:hypothetical protein